VHFLLSAVVFIVLLGVLVLFHEFGHFVMAKLFRMKVYEFAFGFGPVLARLFKRNETEYTIHAIPAGGFVRIAGMDPGEEGNVEGGFNSKPIWQRALVIFAGPFMSLILGYLVLLMMGFVWGINVQNTTIENVPDDTPAKAAGIREGDTIIAVDGKPVADGYHLRKAINRSQGDTITIDVKRNGKIEKLRVKPQVISIRKIGVELVDTEPKIKQVKDGSIADKAGLRAGDIIFSIESTGRNKTDITVKRNENNEKLHVNAEITDLESFSKIGAELYELKTTVKRVPEGSPADVAGLRKGDVLVSLNSTKIPDSGTLEQVLSVTDKPETTLVVDRNGKQVELKVKPKVIVPAIAKQIGVRLEYKNVYTRLVGPEQKEDGKKAYTNLLGGIKLGTIETYRWTSDTIQGLFSKQIKQAGGVIAIGAITGKAVAAGAYNVFFLLAMLSITLAVINLIPWPILDGGHLLFLFIEKIRGKQLEPSKWNAIQLAGLVVIIGLAVFLVGYDIARIDMWSNLK